jgi:hypothetical protein
MVFWNLQNEVYINKMVVVYRMDQIGSDSTSSTSSVWDWDLSDEDEDIEARDISLVGGEIGTQCTSCANIYQAVHDVIQRIWVFVWESPRHQRVSEEFVGCGVEKRKSREAIPLAPCVDDHSHENCLV